MDSALERLAQLYGIEPGYHDIWGTWRVPSDETVRALLAAMGVDAHDPGAVEATLAANERETWSRALAPITVMRAGELGRGIRIQLADASLGRPLGWVLAAEGGEIREESFTPLRLAAVEEYRRVKGQRTGQALVQALQNSPLRDVTIDHEPTYAPVRGVEL